MTARKFNPSNERIKHRYLAFLGNAKQMSNASVDQSAATLADYEQATGLKDFQSFRIEPTNATCPTLETHRPENLWRRPPSPLG